MSEKMEAENVGSSMLRGHMLFKMGKYNEAEVYYKSVLHSLPEGDPNIQECYRGLGAINIAKVDYDAAYQYFTKAVELELKNLPVPDRLQLAYSYGQIGICLKTQRKYKESLENFKRARELYIQTRGHDHVDTARVYVNIGLLHHKQENSDLALSNLNNALKIQLKIFSEIQSEMNEVVAIIASIYHEKKEYELAMEHYKKSLAIQLKSFPNHDDTVMLYINIGSIFAAAWQNYSEALINYEKALDICQKKALPTNHPKVILIQNRILATKLLVLGAVTMNSYAVVQGDSMKITGFF